MRKLAFFSALCFFLSAVEYAIPKPVPFFRIGLANLPIMFSFLCMTRKESTALIFLKVLLQAFISGTLFSYIFLFSLAGSVASGFVMMAIFHLFYERKLVSWLGISAAGGFANNIAQLTVAYFFMFGQNIKFFTPVLLCISFFASIFMGLFTNLFVEKSQWLKKISSCDCFVKTETESFDCNRESRFNAVQYSILILSFCLLAVLFFVKSLPVAGSIFFVAVIFCAIRYKKIRIVPSIIIIVSVTFFSVLVPHGKVLYELGKLKITDGALFTGLLKSFRLCGAVFLSKMAVSRNMNLPSKAGKFMELVFSYFDRLSQSKVKLNRKNFMKNLDSVLLEISEVNC